jgi:hypothetical protein
MHAILCDLPSNVVSLSDNMAAFDAAAGAILPSVEGKKPATK